MSETWKPYSVYGVDYEVSNYGRIRRAGDGFIYKNTNSKGDYLRRVLGKTNDKNKRRTVLMHRVVYELFVGTIPRGFQVHHIDGNRQNNRMDNLAVIKSKDHHRITLTENPTMVDGMVNYNRFVRPERIAQYSLDGDLIAEYANCKEASRATGVCSRNILQVAHKTPYNTHGAYRKQAGGYIWRIAE